MSHSSNKHTARGYTLIETLVAITILMLAIVGPLTVANKALTAALDARNQVIAYNLAQETMEDVKNWKDNAIVTSPGSWPMAGCSSQVPNACGTVATLNGANASYSIVNCGACALYDVPGPSGMGYTYTLTGAVPTPFTRYFYVTPTLISGEAYVTVVVSWNTGSTPNQVKLQELMTNKIR